MVLETVGSNPIFHPIDPLAQSVEHYIGNVEVAGSIPAVSSISPGVVSGGFFCFCVRDCLDAVL